MAMTQEEKIEIADMVRSRDRFGPVSEEELAALPGKETELWIRTKNGKTVHVFEERPENLPEQAALLVWDIDYSLAPENPFPFAAEEAYEIVSYAFEHSTELGIDQEKIILAGHSAGGNLVASVLIKNEETKELHPCCALMEYFPTDNTVDPVERLSEELKKDPFWVKRGETEKMYTDFYVGDADPSDPLCSPAFAKDQALAAFPDCLIISAGEDSLRDDTEVFGMRLAKAGVCVTMQRIIEAMHGFTTNRTSGWERALDRQYKFFQEHLR